ncbi:hypothetical protein J7M07_08345 [bacterium]|nr:hypothetical protein [bacterium]
MSSKFKEIDLTKLKRYSISERESKVREQDFGKPVKGGKSFRKWYDSLPNQLATKAFKKLVFAMRKALSRKDYEIAWMMGAHVIKCGLSPYLIDLMKRKYITSLATNGASVIHDLEIAFFGETSENVPERLEEGKFGFTKETADLAFEAAEKGYEEGLGLGEALGKFILKKKARWAGSSILAQAYRFNVPFTVHIAIGTDILHQHHGFNGSIWGGMSHRDFRIFAARIENLGRNGGVVLNVGSAVIMPEVFLKSFSIARNLGVSFKNITVCNMDMINHYRPTQNVLNRPAAFGGDAISLTGHHEIMIPLLYSALLS